MKGVSDNILIWKGAIRTRKGESCTKSSTGKIPWGWSEFKRTDGWQYLWFKQTRRRTQENRRIYNNTTPIKDRNLSTTRIEDPPFEGIFRQNNYSVKYKPKYHE